MVTKMKGIGKIDVYSIKVNRTRIQLILNIYYNECII